MASITKPGEQFRNKYQEHDNPPATRIIEVIKRRHGIITYWVVERHRLRNLAPDPSYTYEMSIDTLLEKYEHLPKTS